MAEKSVNEMFEQIAAENKAVRERSDAKWNAIVERMDKKDKIGICFKNLKGNAFEIVVIVFMILIFFNGC